MRNTSGVSERDMKIPALQAMKQQQGGYIAMPDLRQVLETVFQPTGKDAQINPLSPSKRNVRVNPHQLGSMEKRRWAVSFRRFGFLGVVALALLIQALPSHAYEEDTHFLITYVICRATGFTHQEALTVAAVDQGMDDSTGTVANGGPSGIIPNIPEESLWHALDKDGQMGPKGVLARKQYLFKVAESQTTPQDKLLYLGVFFHYQQDTWAHRHHYDGNPHSVDAYTTYNTPLGHARHGHQPDRPPFDPMCAYSSLEDGFNMARIFLKDALGREPDPFFASYQPYSGAFQWDAWPDDRNGKYFHTLGYRDATATPAQAFLCRLIQAQINAYTSSSDANPNFFLRKTADEANFETVRSALQGVCNNTPNLSGKITIPSRQDKKDQKFGNLTTSGLAAAL